MKKMLKVMVSFLVSLSLVQNIGNVSDINAQSVDSRSLGSITLAEGTSDEFVVPADNTGKIEAALSAEFAQANSKKPVMSKEALTAVGFDVGNSTEVIYPTSDGNFLAVVQLSNYLTYATNGGPRIETSYVVKLDSDGNIISWRNIPLNLEKDGFIQAGRNTWDIGMQSSVRGTAQISGDSIVVMYDGQRPGQTSSHPNAREYPRIATINQDMSVDIAFTDLEFNGFTTGNQILRPSQIGDEVFYFGFRMTNARISDTLDVFKVDIDSGFITEKYALEAPDWNVMFPTEYPGPSGSYWKQELMEVRKTADGNFVGRIVQNNQDSSLRRVMVIIWDSNFNIKYSKVAPDTTRDVDVMSEISDASTIYYLEDDNIDSTELKKLNTATGEITVVTSYPTGTKIEIIPAVDEVYGTEYKFYGSITRAEGQFNGYSANGGAVTGALNSDFTVYNASVVESEEEINMNTMVQIGDTDRYMVGGMTVDQNYADINTEGGVWPDQSGDSSLTPGHAYFGTMILVDDYAPGIKVDGKTIVNKDQMETEEQWDAALMEQISVNDIYELTSVGNEHPMEWLRARIN